METDFSNQAKVTLRISGAAFFVCAPVKAEHIQPTAARPAQSLPEGKKTQAQTSIPVLNQTLGLKLHEGKLRLSDVRSGTEFLDAYVKP